MLAVLLDLCVYTCIASNVVLEHGIVDMLR